MSLKKYEIIQKLPHVANLIPIAFVVVFLHLSRQNGNVVHLDQKVYIKQGPIRSNDSISRRCDLFSGRWIYDNISYPLYKEERCSFMEGDFSCEKYGRKDLKYQNWRWQPHHCDLPRFNGAALLEKIKGKKLIFIGDSLLRNQWRSMLCLIESYLPASSHKSVKLNGNLMYYHDIEYNATIGFYWSPMLVGSSGDDVEKHEASSGVTVQVKSIEEHGRHWVDADFLIFDSYAWWVGRKALTVLWGSFGSPNATRKTISRSRRPFEIALNTWSDWLEMNINRTKTKLFFMSLSPFHLDVRSGDEKQSCYKQTEPIFKEDYWGPGTNRDVMIKAETIIHKLEKRGVKVEYLNITHLSDYRKDAHPSIYRALPREQKAKQLADPESYSDCIHWCLPGLPDVWNQILYSYVMKPLKQ